MPIHSLRVVIPIIVSALLTTACGTDATGECRGTHLGANVNWPIDGEMSRWIRNGTNSQGVHGTWIVLHYSPNGNAGLRDFGVDIQLAKDASVRGMPVTVALSNEAGRRLVPESGTLVREWIGHLRTRSDSGTGFPEASGVPMVGSVTLEEVSEDMAAGRFVYRYEDGSELACTFNVPSPERAASIWEVDGDDDDDDDD